MAVAKGKLFKATELWATLEEGIGNATDNVDWYNVRSCPVPQPTLLMRKSELNTANAAWFTVNFTQSLHR